ncbi:MAG: NADH-quinone oxidoreductase subunit NuoK [bacterium]|nr:NADH-quinone oxidoreductase subunit NuoK [bacterium]
MLGQPLDYYLTVSLTHYLVLSAVLFCMGVFVMSTKRNAIGILIGVEMVLNAVNLNLVAFSRYHEHSRLDGQIMALFIIVLAAAGAAVGVALAMNYYKNHSSIDVDRGAELQG